MSNPVAFASRPISFRDGSPGSLRRTAAVCGVSAMCGSAPGLRHGRAERAEGWAGREHGLTVDGIAPRAHETCALLIFCSLANADAKVA